MQIRVVRVNERGLRIGEDHHRAVLTDDDVALMLSMRARGVGWKRLAATFEVSVWTCRDICSGRTRAQTVAGHRGVRIPQPAAATVAAP